MPLRPACRPRPALLALALAAGFAAAAVQAQPSGAQAIHGAATLSQQGNQLVVTTQNGAGTSHSAINWQSFSIPAGTSTHFAQPGATSTSINRVLGPDPSAIFGTLSSNGRLVLVNPAGIAVGAGAVVDTAGFTASTLRMSDADALAGRLRFGDGSAAGPLRVDGQVLARSGDVVLIGSDVQAGAQALIQSPQGATLLAAGRRVEVTGRGLEGIVFEVQAPTDQAVNLGTLRGDAVGVFAGTLRHSGLVQASAATLEGGRVVLKASEHAEAAGVTQAQGLGGAGGQVDVLGRTVGVMAGALIDTSNTDGGGRIRVGGDYKGGSAEVPNAQVTWVAGDAQLRANATQQGDGGRVIVWADDTTRAYGRIEAKGGANGGNGGFVETSGKRYLDVNGARVDASAARGQAGTWLLDPNNVTIVAGMAANDSVNQNPAPNFGSSDSADSVLSEETLNTALNSGAANVVVSTSGSGGSVGDIVFDTTTGAMTIGKTSPGTTSLELQAHGNIVFAGTNRVHFYADDSGGGPATLNVNFQPGAGSVLINPGAWVEASTSGNGNQVNLQVPGGAILDNAGTLALNLNARVNLATGATLHNNGQMFGSGGANGGIAGTGTFRNSGNVNYSQGSIRVDSLNLMGGSLNLAAGTDLVVNRSFQATGGTFDFGGNKLELNQQSGDLVIPGAGYVHASGSVKLKALAGNIQVATDVYGATIEMTAGGHIDSSGVQLSTYGTAAPGPVTVNLVAGGDIAFGDIDTGGDPLHATGVNIDAGGHVSGYEIRSDGAYGSEGPGGNGGSVAIRAGGSVDLQYIQTYGSSGSSGGRGGDGGAVDIRAGGAVTVTYIDTVGGSGDNGSRGGNAGAVTIDAGGTLGIDSIWAYGGDGGDASGSQGGAGGSGAEVKLLQRSGHLDLSNTYVDAEGGWGGDSDTIGGTGGQGGRIQASAAAGGVLMEGYGRLSVRGGWGGDTYGTAASARGGQGGNGGSIRISAADSSRLLASLDAAGGDGGWAPSSGSSAIGGKGGNGGSIEVALAGGSLTLAGEVMAGAGLGGEAADYETGGRDPSRIGARGDAWGSFRTVAPGGIVVPFGLPQPTFSPMAAPESTFAPMESGAYGDLVVDAQWTNEANLAIASGARVLTSQTLANNGSIDIAAGASLELGHHDDWTDTFTPGGVTLLNNAGATLKGSGMVAGDVVNAGTVAVGGAGAIGTLLVAGNYTQQSTGVLQMDIAANSPYLPGVTYDQLVVLGNATLGGQLQVAAVPAVTTPSASLLLAGASLPMASEPAPTPYYELLSAGAASGQFSLISGPPELVSQIRMNVGGAVLDVPGLRTSGLLAAMASVLSGVTLGQIQQVITESVNNSIAGEQAQPGDEDRRNEGDIVVTDEACKPA
ncbi:filamentous hemagglutinin N-terminal domain-containing protein [Ramlibacter tataouinensis]|uniref:two-partner secretion domain-containing protein n=1 Tax=Ramlibacter tataouinensis TaxID=94132 RepID=UPI0022F3F454|nr:filamentous hemagglutinin N-terminal domain-containing protein [Ramlibacter tataouinensis]WBY00162.1 filamentous hemagglutinin N-terminal domain-containing protein [Ramlibacter tataouinensis]